MEIYTKPAIRMVGSRIETEPKRPEYQHTAPPVELTAASFSHKKTPFRMTKHRKGL